MGPIKSILGERVDFVDIKSLFFPYGFSFVFALIVRAIPKMKVNMDDILV